MQWGRFKSLNCFDLSSDPSNNNKQYGPNFEQTCEYHWKGEFLARLCWLLLLYIYITTMTFSTKWRKSFLISMMWLNMGKLPHRVVLTSLNFWVCSNCLFSSHKTNTHIQFANKCSTNIVSYLISYCNKYWSHLPMILQQMLNKICW